MRGGRIDHAAVERDESAAAARDDAVTGVGKSGVDTENDHMRRDSARRPGRLQRDPGVEHVVIGGFAVVAHGFIRVTKDLDIVPSQRSRTSGR